MKSAKSIALSLTLAPGAGAAFAEGPVFVDPPFTSTLSRAEVRAQAIEARDAGLFALGDGQSVTGDNGTAVASQLTREQVRAEVAEARRTARGDIASMAAGA